MKITTMRSKLLYLVIGASIYAANASCGEIATSPPEEPNEGNRYIFFMHGKIVEKKGLPARSKKYGSYEYKKMLKKLAKEDFIVISEAREKGTDVYDYSLKVAGQVNGLLDKGVPAKNITISGFSKGGRMTAVISSLLNNKEINYVILAGCRESDISEYNIKLSGRVLSIFDENDDYFGSCEELFSTGGENIDSKEIVLTIGDGHGVFYRPRKEWINPLTSWARQ